MATSKFRELLWRRTLSFANPVLFPFQCSFLCSHDVVPLMNLKCSFEWYCLVEHVGSSAECALIRDAEKKDDRPSEMLFVLTLSCMEITPCIPSREEAQASSSQYAHTPTVIAISFSRPRSIFFHPS